MRTAFRAPCACNRCSLLQHRAGGLRALQTLPQFCAPREYHGRPHETAQPARSMRLAVSGLRLVNSVVLACLARLQYRTGGHGPRESGQSRARGHKSTVGACQHCPRTVHTASASDLSEGLQGLLAVQRAAAVALMVIVAEAIAPGAPVGAPPPLRRRRRECRLH